MQYQNKDFSLSGSLGSLYSPHLLDTNECDCGLNAWTLQAKKPGYFSSNPGMPHFSRAGRLPDQSLNFSAKPILTQVKNKTCCILAGGRAGLPHRTRKIQSFIFQQHLKASTAIWTLLCKSEDPIQCFYCKNNLPLNVSFPLQHLVPSSVWLSMTSPSSKHSCCGRREGFIKIAQSTLSFRHFSPAGACHDHVQVQHTEKQSQQTILSLISFPKNQRVRERKISMKKGTHSNH